MSKLLSIFIQKSAGSHIVNSSLIMSKRSGYHRTPKFKPEVKTAAKHSMTFLRKPEKVQTLNEPIKSTADKKLYKTIRLENGLTALLISDPTKIVEEDQSSDSSSNSETESSGTETDGTTESGKSKASDSHGYSNKRDFDDEKLAACALCVGVGSYSDPPDIQGLAHFVEHMVFMGSEKYPKENEFDSFIKKRGGSDNASTDCEVTTFYFEIQEKHLPHAMDMFSQFFVSPLMKKEAMTREREAIESEFAIAAPSDANRKDQLLSSFFPPDHPARTFTWGNLKSLREDLNDDEKLYNAAHEFRKRHYSAHRMTVAVQARMELSTLENYVVNSFGQIPTNKLPSDDFSAHNFTENIITKEFTSMYYVKPLSDTTELHLTWMFRSLISEYESKPHQYISYLLGHEGKGSLLSYLRKKVWALGIYTGNSESGIDYTSMYSLFSTQIILTKDGLENMDKVLEALFSYIEMIRRLGPSERIFHEIKTIEETGFRFEEESQPADYVESLAENMHFYPPEHYITGDRLYYKYDPEAVMGLLDDMTPDKVNILVLSNKHTKPVKYDLKEKWFGTQYTKKEIPHSWLQAWCKVTPYDAFHMPDKNIYITTNFDLIPPAHPYVAQEKKLGIDLESSSMRSIYDATNEAGQAPKVTFEKDELVATVNNFRLDQPNLFRKNRHMELWYKPDFKFKFPTALLYFYFITPLSLKSPKDACLLDLWTDVLQQNLKEEVYPANMADLSHSVYVLDKGINLKVNGYNQNIHLLVELISREMVSTTDNLTQSMFEAVREVRGRLYHNLLLKPHKLAKDIRMEVLLDPYVSPRDKAMAIKDVTLHDLKNFTQTLFSKMYLQVLVEGNIEWSDAVRISENVVKTLQFQPLEKGDMQELRVHRVPLGSRTVRVMSLNPASTNSIVTNYYQGGRSTAEDTAVLEILMMLMEEPVFDQLRTKEQLGYSVFSMMRYTFGVLGFTVTVNTQVDKFSVSHVDRRVEAFLKKFARDMRRLNEKTLMATKNSLEQLKHTSDYELKEEVERNWREIQSREYKFNRMFEEALAIKAVRLADIKAWVENHFSSGNRANFRKISIQINGHKNKQNSIAMITDDKINDYRLTYLLANETEEEEPETNPDEFVTDVVGFKRELPIVLVPEVQLPPC